MNNVNVLLYHSFLIHALKLTSTMYETLQVRNYLDARFADEDFEFFVIDTHPAKDKVIKCALHFADIVLVPIMCDYLSIVNLRSAVDYVASAGVSKGQIAVVKNCMSRDTRLPENFRATIR